MSEVAYQDLQGTWADPAMNFDITIYSESNSTTTLTTNFGGQGIPTVDGVTFTNVQASSGTLFLGYELVTNPGGVLTKIGVDEGSGPIFDAERATVIVTMGNQDYVEPSSFSESGPAGFDVKDLQWSSWGGETATAHGAVSVQGSTSEPVEVELTGNDDVGTYQGLVVIVNGELPTTYTASELNSDFSAG